MKLSTFEKQLSKAITDKEANGYTIKCSTDGDKYVAKVSDGTTIIGDFTNLAITITHKGSQ